MKELGDKVEDAEREKVDAAIKELKEVVDGDDLAAIQAKSQALAEASAGIAQRMYEAQAPTDAEQETGATGDEGVVDAEFEEVDDDDKSKSA